MSECVAVYENEKQLKENASRVKQEPLTCVQYTPIGRPTHRHGRKRTEMKTDREANTIQRHTMMYTTPRP